MGLNTDPRMSGSILNAVKGALGLFGDTNKAEGGMEGLVPVPEDEYESKLSEKEIVELVRNWRASYAPYLTEIEKTQKISYEYWIGLQRKDQESQLSKDAPQLIDNLIFESLETFLPIATRSNPEPVVQGDSSDFGQKVAKDLQQVLVSEADRQKLRRKLAKLCRQWALYRIGAIKISWDPLEKAIRTDVINSQRFIFDKDGHIDEGGHFVGEYIGEKKKISAAKLVELFPKKKPEIEKMVKGKMGTKLEYYEWWYRGDDVFYTIEDVVLGKFKNPNWNYDIGDNQGINHLPKRMPPYLFLSVFSAGLHPHDDTSLILQNITIQDLVNRRWRQIDKNVDGMNNGMVVSGKSFTEEQASQAASALRRGVAIRVPDGNVDGAVKRFPPNNIPGDVFNNLQDARSELRGIFGTAGSTPEALNEQDTVRGKIMVSQADGSRIGGGITEQIEQIADSIYNWWVQMMFVYWDEEHYVAASGVQGASEEIALKNNVFPLLRHLTVTVKEGSLIPKDPLTQRNEAIDLWSANAIDPLNFFKRLDVPDPAQQTQQLILWQMLQRGQIPPQYYLPSFQIPVSGAPGQPQGTGGPAVNPVGGPEIGAQPPAPQSAPAVQAQSQQLLQSVPIK